MGIKVSTGASVASSSSSAAALRPLGQIAAYEDVYVPDGVTPVVIRCDDGPTNDYSLTLGYLTARDLVAGFALIGKHVNPADPFYDNNPAGFLQPAQALEMQHAGMEIMNHSRTHDAGAPSASVLYDRIVTAGDDLRSLGLNVDSFVMPGTWDGVLDTGPKWDSSLGQAIRATHATAMAYMPDGWPGKTKPFPAWSPYGTGYIAPTDLAGIQAAYDQARSAKGSLYLLFHTGGFGAAGSASWLNFLAVLDWLVTERAAGRAIVMTPSAALRAKRGARVDLCPDGSFEAWAADPADTVWTISGTASAAAGRLAGSSVQLNAGNSAVLAPQAPDALRTIEITGYCKNVAGNASARVVMAQKLGGATLQTRTKTIALTDSATWVPFRTYMRMDPRANFQGTGAASTALVQITLAQSTAAVQFDDVAIYKS